MLYESFTHAGVVVDIFELDEPDEDEFDDHAPGTAFIYAWLTDTASTSEWIGPAAILTDDAYDAFRREVRQAATRIDRESPLMRRVENRLAARGISRRGLTPRFLRRRARAIRPATS
jgi:hypothetical protein